MKTIKTRVFTLNELPESVQEKAHARYLSSGEQWIEYDSTIETTKTALAFLGVDVEHVYFSGFSSQGDCACYVGSVRAYPKGGLSALRAEFPESTELHKLAKAYVNAMANDFYQVRGTIRQSGHYYHSNCTAFSLSHDLDMYRPIHEDEIISALRACMDYTYKELEKEYDYQTSFEHFKQLSEANDWHFESDGTMNNS